MGFSRSQLLQYVADHAIADSGRRRFLLHSDHEERTWVSIAAPLRRMPRRHRRGSRRVSSTTRIYCGWACAAAVRITVFCSAIVIDVIVHCHTAGALLSQTAENNCPYHRVVGF